MNSYRVRNMTGWHITMVSFAVLHAVLSPDVATADVTIRNLGVPPGAAHSYAYGISGDGSAITGTYWGVSLGEQAFRWTENGGFQDIGEPGSQGYAISADGTTVVGRYFLPDGGGRRAYRWTSDGGLQNLGNLDGPYGWGSIGLAVSANGSIVAGVTDNVEDPGDRAFRWTSDAGMQNLGALPDTGHSTARSLSYDGSAIAGISGNSAILWSAATGMEDLGTVPGAIASVALAISGDGRVVAGANFFPGSPSSICRAFRWTAEGGMQDLGVLPGELSAMSLSADGSVMVGHAGRGFLWTQDLGIVDFMAHLESLGVDLTGWGDLQAQGVSADGSAIVGSAIVGSTHLGPGAEPGVYTRAWLVTGIPEPSMAALFGLAGLLSTQRLQRRFTRRS